MSCRPPFHNRRVSSGPFYHKFAPFLNDPDALVDQACIAQNSYRGTCARPAGQRFARTTFEHPEQDFVTTDDLCETGIATIGKTVMGDYGRSEPFDFRIVDVFGE